MRFRLARAITVFVVVLNVLAMYFIWKLVVTINHDDKLNGNQSEENAHETLSTKPTSMHISEEQLVEKSLTLVIRSFEFFEQDVAATVASFLLLYPNLQILIISDVLPYPPILLQSPVNMTKNVQIISLRFDLTSTSAERNPLLLIKTKYVLFVPDSTQVLSTKLLPNLIVYYPRLSPSLVAIPIATPKSANCLKIFLNLREWFIRYESSDGHTCDAVKGKHAIFVETSTLSKLPDALLLPFPNALYIQTTVQNLKVKRMTNFTLSDGKALFTTQHAQWKRDQLHKARETAMFAHFRLKKVVRESGSVEIYGCTRETPRCFGTVVGDMPEYLYEGRWTPPCCLEALRQTARHVFKVLEKSGVRYWLEGGSLLGAMRASNILPWDYDVDVGIYQEDIPLCSWLSKAQKSSVVDEEGFVWEKAVEGDFFRVQFSSSNRLHVDLFPFYSRNGTMTKNTWFASHKQDRAFPEHYLNPIASIEFVGRKVSSPNNIREFLEFKFGPGVIENPEYPDPQKLKFSTKDFPEITNTIPAEDMY